MKHQLSATQLSMFRRCSMQYWFRYKAGIKLKPVGKMTRGRAVHKGVEVGYKHKVATEEDPPREMVLDATSQEFDHVAPITIWEKDEKPGPMKDKAIRLSSMHHASIMPRVEPVMVEHRIRYDIAPDISMEAFLDCIEVDGTIRDVKAVGRKVADQEIKQSLQLASYVIAAEATGLPVHKIALDRLVAVSQPYIQPDLELRRDQVDTERIKHVANSVKSAIEADIYHPCDNLMTCSWCGYRDICLGAKWWTYLVDPELARRAARNVLEEGLLPEYVQSVPILKPTAEEEAREEDGVEVADE